MDTIWGQCLSKIWLVSVWAFSIGGATGRIGWGSRLRLRGGLHWPLGLQGCKRLQTRLVVTLSIHHSLVLLLLLLQLQRLVMGQLLTQHQCIHWGVWLPAELLLWHPGRVWLTIRMRGVWRLHHALRNRELLRALLWSLIWILLRMLLLHSTILNTCHRISCNVGSYRHQLSKNVGMFFGSFRSILLHVLDLLEKQLHHR